MSKKTVALYSPYLATLGGGERHILSILQTLSKRGMNVIIFWKGDLSQEIHEQLQISIPHLRFVKMDFSQMNFLEKLQALWGIDHFFYVTDGSYFFSSAHQTHIFCTVPDKKLYEDSLLNRLKTSNAQWIANGHITAYVLAKSGKKSHIITPNLPHEFFEPVPPRKEKVILSVGRFFPHLHSKRQDVAISWFQDLRRTISAFSSYKLVLAGSVMTEDMPYLNSLKKLAQNDPQIEFQVNTPFSKLMQLYDQAEYYWHFAGFGVDENTHPEQTEHLGITPMEAMARGCLTYAYKAGGPKEIIKDGSTGFLFTSQTELFEKMSISKDQKQIIVTNAQTYTKEHFSYDIFEKRVKEVILGV